MIEKITENGLDAVMSKVDKWSRVLAWTAVLAAIVFVLIPAIISVWGR